MRSPGSPQQPGEIGALAERRENERDIRGQGALHDIAGDSAALIANPLNAESVIPASPLGIYAIPPKHTLSPFNIYDYNQRR